MAYTHILLVGSNTINYFVSPLCSLPSRYRAIGPTENIAAAYILLFTLHVFFAQSLKAKA